MSAHTRLPVGSDKSCAARAVMRAGKVTATTLRTDSPRGASQATITADAATHAEQQQQ